MPGDDARIKGHAPLLLAFQKAHTKTVEKVGQQQAATMPKPFFALL